MREVFSHTFHAGWGLIDSNGHMANTAYLDLAADTRFVYFEANGFSASDFARERIGPVVKKDLLEYRSEVRFREAFDVILELAGLSRDGSRFRLRNTFRKRDGAIAAIVTTDAGWMSLDQRRLVVPPPALLTALRSLVTTDDYEDLPSSIASD